MKIYVEAAVTNMESGQVAINSTSIDFNLESPVKKEQVTAIINGLSGTEKTGPLLVVRKVVAIVI